MITFVRMQMHYITLISTRLLCLVSVSKFVFEFDFEKMKKYKENEFIQEIIIK